EEGIKTCVVSTDRDAFQLVTENVCLMMTPRGVADVNVYTPERVELRLGITPDKVPDFIGLKGDPSDNIPGVPGIGDKTAGQLVAQYGSLEAVLEHADELSPARRKNITEHAEQARQSKELATMRRDLELDCDPAELVLLPPDRSELREMFRRFEFRNLLGRVDILDEAVPAQAMRMPGTEVAWHEGEFPEVRGRAAIAIRDGRFALAREDDGVIVGPWDASLERRLQDRHGPDGRDHGAPRRPARGARGEGVRARRRGVHARLDAAGRAHPVREAAADTGTQGQDRLFDRHARPADDPARARDRRG